MSTEQFFSWAIGSLCVLMIVLAFGTMYYAMRTAGEIMREAGLI